MKNQKILFSKQYPMKCIQHIWILSNKHLILYGVNKIDDWSCGT